MSVGELTVGLKDEAASLGFVGCAVAAAEPLAETRAVIAARVERGSYEELPWFTVERAGRSTEPARTLPGARSVVTLSAPYRAVLEVDADALGDEPRGRVARYAWG